MKNLGLGLAVLVAIGLIAGAAFLGYIWFSGGDAEPSMAVSVAICDEPDETDIAANLTLFCMVGADSEALFQLQEDLFGERNTVIGGTSELAGAVLIDFDNPGNSELSQIRVNARTLVTDNEFRNRAVRSEILHSNQDEFEFIDFQPTALNGLPASVEIGGTYDFEIVGDLTIVGQTHEASFAATVTIDSETHIGGTANTTISYADWGVTVPDARGVANVDDEVLLVINFEAESP